MEDILDEIYGVQKTIKDVPLNSLMTPEPGEQKQGASMATHYKAGHVDDVKEKIRIYSQARGIPSERYGVHKGDIVYIGDDGNLYPETPDTWWSKIKEISAETGAHAPAIGLAIVLGAANPPLAILGGAGGEGYRKSIGALMGEEQTVKGNLVDMGVEGGLAYGGDVAGQALMRGANRVLSMSGGKLAKEAGTMRGEIDLSKAKRLLKTSNKYGINITGAEATGNRSLVNWYNLLGDLDNTADLVQKDRLLRMSQIDEGVRKKFLPEVISGNVEGQLKTASKLVESSKKAMQKPVDIRRAKAAPIYKKAFSKEMVDDIDRMAEDLARNKNIIKSLENPQTKPDVSAMVSDLEKRGVPTMKQLRESERGYIERISSDYQRIFKKDAPVITGKPDVNKINALKKENESIELALSGKPPKGFIVPQKKIKIDVSGAVKEIDDLLSATVPQDPSYKALIQVKNMIEEANGSLQKLDRVKRSGIDNILNKSNITPTMKRELKIVKTKLVEAMDSSVSEYARARKIFSSYSEEVDKQTVKTIVSRVSSLKGDQQTKAMRIILASPDSTAETVLKARKQIANDDAWMKGVKDYIVGEFDKITDLATDDITNIGGMFNKKLFGSPHKKQILKAALDEKQYTALEDLMSVLHRTGLIMRKESATATRQTMMQKSEGLAGKLVMAKTRPLYTYPRIIGDFFRSLKAERYQRKMLEALMDENAILQITKMRQLPEGSKELIPMFTKFAAMVSGNEIGSGISMKRAEKNTKPKQ